MDWAYRKFSHKSSQINIKCQILDPPPAPSSYLRPLNIFEFPNICIFFQFENDALTSGGFPLKTFFAPLDYVINHRTEVAQEHVSVFVLWHRLTEKNSTNEAIQKKQNKTNNQDTSHK